jgi:hypothetical protein
MALGLIMAAAVMGCNKPDANAPVDTSTNAPVMTNSSTMTNR